MAYPGGIPVCVKCRLEMRCLKNSFLIRDPEVGSFPSTYWLGDKWGCPQCGAEIVVGRGAAIEPNPDNVQTFLCRYGPVLEFRYSPKEVPSP